MKRLFVIFAVIAGIMLLSSCEKDDDNPVLNLDEASSPALHSPDAGLDIDLEELSEEEEPETFHFQWSPADYYLEGLPDVSYRLVAYLSSHEDNFTDHIFTVTETTGTETEVTVSRLNQLLFQMEATPFQYTDVTFRVMAFLNLHSDATWLYSDPLELNIRGFEVFTETVVFGDYQGWDVDNDATVMYSPDADNQFEGYFYFEEAGDILFSVGTTGLFVYGDAAGDGTLEPIDSEGDEADYYISVDEPGVYRITMDYDELTYEVFKTDWAMIGDAADGWNDDVPMDVDEDYWESDWKVRYTITYDMVEGHFKFRANEEWDPPAGLNMGLDEDAEEEGVLMYFGFGNDIPIESDGTYHITLDLTGPVYRYEIEEADE